MLTRRAAVPLTVLVGVVLVGYVLLPSLATFRLGLEAAALRTFLGGWAAPGVRALLVSVGVALASVVGAGVVGTALAYAFFRFDLPLRRTLQTVATWPLALPPLVGVLAFVFLYSESGMIPRAVQAAFGLAEAPFAFEGLAAVVLVHTYVFYVYFYLFTASALAGLDPGVLEASADLGAGEGTTFRRVVLPLLRPALTGAALLVFMVSMASFTAPLLFAEDQPFLTLAVYNYKANGDLALAATAATVLTAICLAFLAVLEARPERRQGLTASKGASRGSQPLTSPLVRALAGAGVALALAFVLLPIATVGLLSFVKDGTWTTEVLPPVYTLENYRALFAEPRVFAPLAHSLWMAALATAGNLVFGVLAAVVLAKGGVPGAGLLRALALLPFAIPGTVLALNLIVAFDAPTPWAGGQVLIGTVWLLPLAYFVRHLPFVVRATLAALDAFDDRLAEASADLGAGAWMTFRRVVWPLLRPGVAAGTLLTFVTALGEFVASILLYVYLNRPVSVEIFSNLRLFNLGAAAAYSVLLMALVAFATAAVQWVTKRSGQV